MKRFALILFVCSAVLTVLCSCGKKAETSASAASIKLGVSIPAPTHGWASGVVWNAEELKKELESKHPGTEVIVVTAKDAADQVSGIENLLMQNVNGLVVMAQNPVPLAGVCKRAKKQGVYLVVVSNPLPDPVQDVFVNGDNRSFGVEAARAIGQTLNGEGDIVVFKGMPCDIDTARVTGFTDTLKAEFPKIRILSFGDSNWNPVIGQNVMEVFLQKYPKIDGVWAGDDDVLTGVLNAYEKSGRKDVRTFVGGGASKGIVKKLMDQNSPVKATVTYSPAMIRTGMMAAFDALQNGGQTAQKEIIIPSKIVTANNAKTYYSENSPY